MKGCLACGIMLMLLAVAIFFLASIGPEPKGSSKPLTGPGVEELEAICRIYLLRGLPGRTDFVLGLIKVAVDHPGTDAAREAAYFAGRLKEHPERDGIDYARRILAQIRQ